jgi:hypothetical protein
MTDDEEIAAGGDAIADAYERGRQDAAQRCWELADMASGQKGSRLCRDISREFNLDGLDDVLKRLAEK